MNLAKLFNFKYFMQNVKKSKMAILLFLSIVPIFTVLTIITTASDYTVLEFHELGLANIIFMYITPLILSFSLFGYVYKKKSIDFVGSMPISRKSIFITNTVGGIILIILSQLVTMLLSLVLSLITTVNIFSQMILDIFIYQTIAYIFVFAVTNLAMSVSGNLLTQIVVTLLILFIVPATIFYADLWGMNSYELIDGNYNVSSYSNIHCTRNYTAPSMILDCMLASSDYGFNGISILKMVVLSIIYIALAYKMFQVKKMEFAGESFENKYIHLIVKGLTTIPFIMILVALADSSEWEVILFLIAIIAVYYLIYDLITNKKNKIGVNLVAMIGATLILFSFYSILGHLSENIERKIDIEDIKSASIQSIGYKWVGLNYEIKDDALIEKILYSRSNRWNGESENITLELRLAGGNKMTYSTSVDGKLLKEILADTKVSKSSSLEIEYYSDLNLSKGEQKNLKIALNNAVREKEIYDLYQMVNNVKYDYIYGYEYKNHRVRKLTFPITVSQDVFNIITIGQNNNTAEFIRKRRDGYYMSLNFSHDGFEFYNECPEEIKDYVISNKDKICHMNQKYIYFTVNGNKFYTNDIENVINIIKNSKEYKAYHDAFIQDKEIEVPYEVEDGMTTIRVTESI